MNYLNSFLNIPTIEKKKEENNEDEKNEIIELHESIIELPNQKLKDYKYWNVLDLDKEEKPFNLNWNYVYAGLAILVIYKIFVK